MAKKKSSSKKASGALFWRLVCIKCKAGEFVSTLTEVAHGATVRPGRCVVCGAINSVTFCHAEADDEG